MYKSLIKKLKKDWKHISKQQTDEPAVSSFITIRRAVGWLAILLPFALILGSVIFKHCSYVQPSISHYYYTNMQVVFVGTLCAVALFLFSYKGYSILDNWSANLAGLFCLLTSLFPTDISCITIDSACGSRCLTFFPCQNPHSSSLANFSWQGTLHFICAATFLLILAWMSIFLFTKSKTDPANFKAPKRNRNRMYRICGYTMMGSLVSTGLYLWLFEKENQPSQVVFWLETLTLLAFGLSWMTKGEQIFPDKTAKFTS